MKKRLSVLMVLVLMVVSMVSFVSAEELEESTGSFAENFDPNIYGEKLQELEILKGTDKGLELDSELTRVQGMIIYSRILGIDLLDVDEISKGIEIPFDDVPAWAIKEIKILHASGLVNGISSTKLGSNDKMTIEAFTTLILRALEYKDSEGDFVWDKSLDKALEIGILDTDSYEYFLNKDKFTRGDMSYILYRGLNTNIKNHSITLMEILMDKRNPYEVTVEISDEDLQLIPEEFQDEILKTVEDIFGYPFRAKELTMFDVRYEGGDKIHLEFELKIVYDDEDGVEHEIYDSVTIEGDIVDGIIEHMMIYGDTL